MVAMVLSISLHGVPCILTFMGLGIILIVLSGLYHKYQETL